MPTSPISPRRLTHLRQLEAESIHILREVAAEFDRPVMLYSIGKDSSVMVRLAQKAFAPGPLPFPLLHVDTTAGRAQPARPEILAKIAKLAAAQAVLPHPERAGRAIGIPANPVTNQE